MNKLKENSTTIIVNSQKNDNIMLSGNEDEESQMKSKITNLKSSSIKPVQVNRNKLLKSFNKADSKWSTIMNNSKVIITEKDSKKEDSERTERNDVNVSILNKGTNIIDDLL